MGLFLRYNRSAPHQCPTCGDKANGQFLSLWRTKLFGKSYVAKRTKIELELTKYQEEFNQLQTEDLNSISFDQLPKKLKDQVYTMMWADVHH